MKKLTWIGNVIEYEDSCLCFTTACIIIALCLSLSTGSRA